MDRDTAVLRVADGLGFKTGMDARIVLRMQEAQRYLEQGKTLPWFLIEEDDTLTLAEGENSVALPEDFLRETDEGLMRYTPTGYTYPTYVKRRDFDDSMDAYSDVAPAGPKVYVVRKASLYFFPSADRAYTLTWSYYKRGALLSAGDTENEWLEFAPEVLIAETGKRMARDLRDAGALQLFTDMYSEARDALYREMIVRELASGPSQMGGEE